MSYIDPYRNAYRRYLAPRAAAPDCQILIRHGGNGEHPTAQSST